MGNDEAARELEKLRAEMAALKAAREEATPATVAPKDVAAPEDVPAPEQEAASETASADHGNVKSQLEELGELLEAEIRDLPTITCLAVFVLGILVGRILR